MLVGAWDYIKALFCDYILVCVSAILAFLYRFFFPTEAYFLGTVVVLCAMVLDLLTKLFSLSRQCGGLKRAFIKHVINSYSFCKGTTNKMVVFLVMIILCGLAYRLTIIPGIALFFSQMVFMLMFLRDSLSILENLSDAGCDVGVFKKLIRRKVKESFGEDVEQCMEKPHEPPKPEETTPPTDNQCKPQKDSDKPV